MHKKKEGEKGSDKMEVHKNYVKSWGVKRRKRRDEKKLYCQNLLSSHSVSQKGSALSGALLFDFTGCHFLSILFSFILLFFPPLSLPPLPFLPSLIPKAEWQPFIPHQTHFMTAAALHSCWMVCLKDFLTRPWIRLLASTSLFLSAWLDSDADIKWTLIQSPSHLTYTTVYLSVLQVKQQRRPQTSDYAFSLPTRRGHRDAQHDRQRDLTSEWTKKPSTKIKQYLLMRKLLANSEAFDMPSGKSGKKLFQWVSLAGPLL